MSPCGQLHAALLATTGAPPTGSPQDMSSVWVALAILFVAAIVGAIIIAAVSRRLKAAPTDAAAFTLHDLRSLHNEGRLTDEEYDRMKAALLGKYAPAQDDDQNKSNVQ